MLHTICKMNTSHRALSVDKDVEMKFLHSVSNIECLRGILQDILNASKVTQDHDIKKSAKCNLITPVLSFFLCYHTASVYHCYERYLFSVKPRKAKDQFCVSNQEFFYLQIVFFLIP